MVEDFVVNDLKVLLLGWYFMQLNALGKFGGLITGWIMRIYLLALELSPKVAEGSLPGNSRTTFKERTSLLLFREVSLNKCQQCQIYIYK